MTFPTASQYKFYDITVNVCLIFRVRLLWNCWSPSFDLFKIHQRGIILWVDYREMFLKSKSLRLSDKATYPLTHKTSVSLVYARKMHTSVITTIFILKFGVKYTVLFLKNRIQIDNFISVWKKVK